MAVSLLKPLCYAACIMNSPLLIAALCYTIPFIFPHLFWPLIWLFPAFLLVALQQTPSKKDLLFFSSFVWAMHLFPIIDALMYMGSSKLAALLPASFLLGYTIGICLLWLLLMKRLIAAVHNSIAQIAIWTIGLWAYLLFIDQIQFLPLGRSEGNIFASPLLPLAVHPILLGPLQHLSYSATVLIFCLISSLVAAYSWHSSKFAFLALTLCFLIWVALGTQSKPTRPPHWLSKVGHIPLMLPATTSLYSGSAVIAHEISLIKKLYPTLHTVIIPESAWNGSALASCQRLPFFVVDHLIIGGFDGPSGCYNAAFQFHGSRFILSTQKRHALPITERPIFGQWMNDLYFSNSAPIRPADQPRPLHLIDPIGPFVIYICSELFCFKQTDDPYDCPIICIASDWWIRMPHFTQLMALTARLKAICWQRPILYISYCHALYFMPNGNAHPIATSHHERILS